MNGPTPPRALLLDFGGTLAREVPGRGAIYAEAAAAAGLGIDAAAMGRCMAAAHDALPRQVGGAFRYTRPWFEAFIHHVFVFQLGLDPARLGPVKEALFARFSDAATFRVFPDARVLLEAARARGLGLAIVSNWSDALQPLVDALGLGPFDALLASGAERVEKPEPEIFTRALHRLGVSPGEALHAGDSFENDVLGARALGIDAVLLDRGARAGDVDAPVIRTLDELVPRLG